MRPPIWLALRRMRYPGHPFSRGAISERHFRERGNLGGKVTICEAIND